MRDVERKTGIRRLSLGADGFDDVAALYDEYVAKYGKDNADYLMEWGPGADHYNRAAYIDMGFSTAPRSRCEREEAEAGVVGPSKGRW